MYRVFIPDVFIDVEADSEEAAKEAALRKISADVRTEILDRMIAWRT